MRWSRFRWPPRPALQHHGYSQSEPARASLSRLHPAQPARVSPALLTARVDPPVSPLRRAALPRGLAVALSSHSPLLDHSLFWRSPRSAAALLANSGRRHPARTLFVSL